MRIPPGPLTNLLVAVNIAVAAVTLWPSLFQKAIYAGGLLPLRFTAGDAAFDSSFYLLPVWVTPFTAAFLHGGLFHIMLNMLMLLLMGRITERVLGWQGFALLYVAGIVVSSAAEIIAQPNSFTPVVGASGAISAVIGAYLLLFPNAEPKPWGLLPAKYARPVQLLVMWVIINAMLLFAGADIGIGIAIYAHIGGFIAGLLLARPLLLWKYRSA